MSVTIELRPLHRTDLDAARQVLAGACRYERAADVASEKLFGAAPSQETPTGMAAWTGGRLVGVSVVSDQWVRLLAVAPDARGRGIGSALLAAAEGGIARAGHRSVRIADQPGNYLAPGVDERDGDTIGWLERCGYKRTGRNTNLVVAVRDNPRVTAARAAQAAERARQRGYRLRRGAPLDATELAELVGRAFSPAWAFEVERALAAVPAGVHLAYAGSELAAFAAHDGNNQGLGWFGPAGTLPEHRGQGLGEALLLGCLVDVADAGHDTCEVAWIGPRAFYERVCGIRSERHFAIMKKDLEQP